MKKRGISRTVRAGKRWKATQCWKKDQNGWRSTSGAPEGMVRRLILLNIFINDLGTKSKRANEICWWHKVGEQYQPRGKLGQHIGKKRVTVKTKGGRLKFSGMTEEATHLGQTMGFATSWKEKWTQVENVQEWERSEQTAQNKTEAPTCCDWNISSGRRSARAGGQATARRLRGCRGRFSRLKNPKSLSRKKCKKGLIKNLRV